MAGAVALAAALALAAPSQSAGAASSRSAGALPTSIYVQGDSLTADSAGYLRSLAKPSSISIDAKSGRHAYQGIALMRKVKAFPSAVVVGLGSNDDYDAYGVSAFRSNVAAVLGLVGNSRCLVWVNIYQKPTAAQAKKHVMIFSGLNTVLAQTAAAHPNVRIVNWAGLAAANAAWFKYDSMHPTDAGYLARSKAIIAALRTCGGGGGGVVDPGGSDGGGGTSPGV